MHNRHFIINMVINGEKSPAFSATTLTLPLPQIDNTGHIIENTRRNYSRSRSEVEAEIAEAIQPAGSPQSQPKPQSQAQAKRWPLDALAQSAGIILKDTEHKPIAAGQGSDEAPTPTKRKRTRSRRKKISTDEADTIQPMAEQVSDQPADIQINH
jgi:hypothetical protein